MISTAPAPFRPLQLVSNKARQFLDLNTLQDMGVEIIPRLAGVSGTRH